MTQKLYPLQLKMAFNNSVKLSELPFRTSLPISFRSSSLNLVFFSPSKLSLRILRPSSSLRTTEHSGSKDPKPSQKSKSSTAPWINKWSNATTNLSNEKAIAEVKSEESNDQVETRYFDKDKGQNAIERIVLRLRNLGLGSDDEEEEEDVEVKVESRDELPVTGEERLGDLLRREWVRPDAILAEDKHDEMVLPWERGEEKNIAEEEGEKGLKKRRATAPTLAELTLEDEELRRLRRIGINIRERISIPKAGITQAVLEKIHDKWRKEEVVRLKFHEVLARDMKTAHEIVEVCC